MTAAVGMPEVSSQAVRLVQDIDALLGESDLAAAARVEGFPGSVEEIAGFLFGPGVCCTASPAGCVHVPPDSMRDISRDLSRLHEFPYDCAGRAECYAPVVEVDGLAGTPNSLQEALCSAPGEIWALMRSRVYRAGSFSEIGVSAIYQLTDDDLPGDDIVWWVRSRPLLP